MESKKQQSENAEIYWSKLLNRIERSVGWFMLITGLIILIVYALYKFLLVLLSDMQVDFVIRVSLFLILFGLVVLIFSVIREKITLNRQERYKEVE